MKTQTFKIPFEGHEKINFLGQAAQDMFVLGVLDGKRNGTFLEIGSYDPIEINNTYILEKEFDWNGYMVEFDPQWEASYKKERNAHYKIQDARSIDYKVWLEETNAPKNIDYLSIDLEPVNGSPAIVLEKLPLDDYKFSVITFEHDIYRGGHGEYTRNFSRELLQRHNYVMVAGDITNNSNPYEDWYVHPELVDMNRINDIVTEESVEWKNLLWT